MKAVISSGHGKYVSGAVGIINEVTEARRVVAKVAGYLNATSFNDDTSKTQAANLNTIVNFHNSKSRDLDVSVHFNASGKTDMPVGVEVLYYDQQSLAAKVAKAISDGSGLKNRGAKKRTDLMFLNSTHKPAILIEICFVDSSADVKLYQANFDKICRAIAETISGKAIGQEVEKEMKLTQAEFNKMFEIAMKTHDEVVAAKPGSEWSEEDRAWAVDNEFIVGDGKGNYNWKSGVTREAMVSFVRRCLVERY